MLTTKQLVLKSQSIKIKISKEYKKCSLGTIQQSKIFSSSHRSSTDPPPIPHHAPGSKACCSFRTVFYGTGTSFHINCINRLHAPFSRLYLSDPLSPGGAGDYSYPLHSCKRKTATGRSKMNGRRRDWALISGCAPPPRTCEASFWAVPASKAPPLSNSSLAQLGRSLPVPSPEEGLKQMGKRGGGVTVARRWKGGTCGNSAT